MQTEDIITEQSQVAALIGNPVGHSVSPQLHSLISKSTGFPLTYLPFKVDPQDLESAVKGINALGFTGFNVTIPYKCDVIKYLDGISKEARLIGAVNTVKCSREGTYGYNTDADGFAKAFQKETGSDLKGKTILIIGAGGASRAVSVKAAIDGAEKIYIVNRSIEKAASIAEIINKNVRSCAFAYGLQELEHDELSSACNVIVNTTSLGMHPNVDALPVKKDFEFNKSQIVCDIIYNPLKTRFLKLAEEYGCVTVNGLGMLFFQGIAAYEIWTGVKCDDGLLNELYNSFYRSIKFEL